MFPLYNLPLLRTERFTLLVCSVVLVNDKLRGKNERGKLANPSKVDYMFTVISSSRVQRCRCILQLRNLLFNGNLPFFLFLYLSNLFVDPREKVSE